MQIVEGETRLKQQQNLYEAVRADRNLYSKNLIQAQDEIQEMKRKFQIMVTPQRRHLSLYVELNKQTMAQLHRPLHQMQAPSLCPVYAV